MNTPGSILKKRLSSVIRRPSVWMPLLLLVIGIASIIPAAWDAYRAHTIGWVGAIDNTQDRLDEIEQHDGLWSRKYPMSFEWSFDRDGNLIWMEAADYYHVGIDHREFVARPYRVAGNVVEPRLQTMSIAELRHITEPIMYTSPQIDLLEPSHPEEVMRLFKSLINHRLGVQSPEWRPPWRRFFATVQHEGVMEPRPIHDEDSKPITNDAGELERTPEHVFAFYRLTDGSLGSPMSWERFWVQAWGVLKRTMPIPIVLCVLWYVGYLSLYFKRRTRKRLKLGLCIKCAYPMQEDRGGEGLICTECGHLDHAATLSA